MFITIISVPEEFLSPCGCSRRCSHPWYARHRWSVLCIALITMLTVTDLTPDYDRNSSLHRAISSRHPLCCRGAELGIGDHAFQRSTIWSRRDWAESGTRRAGETACVVVLNRDGNHRLGERTVLGNWATCERTMCNRRTSATLLLTHAEDPALVGSRCPRAWVRRAAASVCRLDGVLKIALSQDAC